MELHGGPDLGMEGTWLQLMCYAPSQLRCPKFRSSRVTRGIPESIGKDRGRLRFAKGRVTWLIYELILSYMMCVTLE